MQVPSIRGGGWAQRIVLIILSFLVVSSIGYFFMVRRTQVVSLDMCEMDRLVLEAIDRGMRYMHNVTVYEVIVHPYARGDYNLDLALVTAKYNSFFPPDDVTNVWLKRLILNLTVKPQLNCSGVIEGFRSKVYHGRKIDIFRSIYSDSFFLIAYSYGSIFELNDSAVFRSFLDNVSRDFYKIYGDIDNLRKPDEAWSILEVLASYGYPFDQRFYVECYERWLEKAVIPWQDDSGAIGPPEAADSDIKVTFTVNYLLNIFYREWCRKRFKNETWVQKALLYVLNHQHEDGSFGVTNETFLHENPPLILSSNMVTTLNAVLLFTYLDDPSYYYAMEKALKWILSQQRSDGSWPGWVVGGEDKSSFVLEANWTIPIITQQVLRMLVEYAKWRGLDVGCIVEKYYEPVEFSLSGDEKNELVRYLLMARRLMFEMWDVEDYLNMLEPNNVG